MNEGEVGTEELRDACFRKLEGSGEDRDVCSLTPADSTVCCGGLCVDLRLSQRGELNAVTPPPPTPP